MEVLTIKRYRCQTCGTIYESEKTANDCESRPVLQDKGVTIGDLVRVTGGDGAGGEAIVKSRFIINRDYGHHAWQRYWHTVGLTAKLVSGLGHRQLTFDNYEPVAPN